MVVLIGEAGLRSVWLTVLAIAGALGGCADADGSRRLIDLKRTSAEARDLAQVCQSARSTEVYELNVGRETALRMSGDGACAFSLYRIMDAYGVRSARGSYDAALITTPPSAGEVNFVATESATWVEYTPRPGFVGEDRFSFRLVPGDGVFPVRVEVVPPVAVPAPLRPDPQEVMLRFELNRSDLTAEARQSLNGLRVVLADPRFARWKIDLAGHTDASGAEGYNLRLSERRAEAVRDYLVQQMGVPPARTNVAGYGRSVLLDRERPLEGVNRRVHLTLRRALHTEARPRP